jgi:outer membrane lipoprotein-sorting protein
MIPSNERANQSLRKESMKILIMILLMLLFIPFANAEKDVTLQEIIGHHTKATGGKEAIEKVKAAEIQVYIEEPTFKVKGKYVADRDQRMRIDIYNEGKWVFAEGYDGKTAWERNKENGPAEKSSEQAGPALWHGTVLPGKMFGLHEMESLGHKVTLEGRETVDAINYYVVKVTLSDGFSKFYYIHPENWRIERSRDLKALHPNLDPAKKWTESRYSDFKMQDGVLRPFRSDDYDLKSGQKIQTTIIESFTTNPKIDPSVYRPD